MGSETSSVVLDKGDALVCSVYDCVAREHGPLFFALNMGLLWRNVDGLVKQATNINSAEFLVVVHGVFRLSSFGKAFSEYQYPLYFGVNREPVSYDAVKLMVEE